MTVLAICCCVATLATWASLVLTMLRKAARAD